MKDWNKKQSQESKQDQMEREFEEESYEGPDTDYGLEEPDMNYETEDGEEEWEDEPQPWPTWVMALVFLGMALLAVLICLVLWRFTHPKEEQSGQNIYAEATATPEMTQERTKEPAVEPTPEAVTESSAELAAEETPEPTAEPVEEPASQPSADSEGQAQEPVSGNTNMSFSDVQESVTPKDVVNLRSVPTTLDEENIVVQAQNGEVLLRTGINRDTGWSKIDYNGQTLYAVNQYLTTDLDYKPPVTPSDPNRVSTIGGRIIIFTNCDDWISPKEYVNLRTEPSTSEGNATVSCQLNYGEKVHRTGYSSDSGWSRVEYNGQILYVVTSLMYEVTEE